MKASTIGAAGARTAVTERLIDLRRNWRLILRLSIAPALAWWLSMQIFDHSQAFFAPVAAVLTLTVGAGQRVWVVAEIVAGASFGILVGELIIYVIGRGVWQLVLITALAVVIARLVRMPGVALTQAVVSGVLLIAVVPAPGVDDPAVTRFVDALVGGAVALLLIIVLPANPVREIERGLRDLRLELADILAQTAESLRAQDPVRASAALSQARTTQAMIDGVAILADNVTEMARISPFRWGQREAAEERTKAVADLDHAVRNTRVLTRRAAAMLRHGERAPDGLVQALGDLAVLAAADSPGTDDLIDVARRAVAAASERLTLNTATIASQTRAIVADMLQASGVPFAELDDLLDFD